MKVYNDQCPLCLLHLANSAINRAGIKKFPTPTMCQGCGGVFMMTDLHGGRALTRADLLTIREEFPVTPKHVRDEHDRVVSHMWG